MLEKTLFFIHSIELYMLYVLIEILCVLIPKFKTESVS